MKSARSSSIEPSHTIALARTVDVESLVLTDGVVSLRPVRHGDIDDIYQAVRESIEELTTWMPWAHLDYTRDESVSWVSYCADGWRVGRDYSFTICDAADGSLCGGCGLNHLDGDTRRANLGYWIRASRTGRGLATRAARLLAPWGAEVLALERIEIVAAVGNTRSVRAAEKTGAHREGILRRRLRVHGTQHDAVVFSFVRADFGLPAE